MTLTPNSPLSSKISENFWLGEFALNQPRRRFTAQHQIDTARKLTEFLEEVRSQFGGPVVITSGYRPRLVNAEVGGARFSEHLFDSPGTGAVDFYLPAAELVAVERWCDANWPHSLGQAAARRGFIHLGMRPDGGRNRWQY